MWLYFIRTAKDVIAECKKKGIKVVSLEAFMLTGKGIQPSQEHSITFHGNDGNWDKAEEFLSNIKDLAYLYEIWYEGY